MHLVTYQDERGMYACTVAKLNTVLQISDDSFFLRESQGNFFLLHVECS